MNLQIDRDKLPKQWLYPANRAITIDEENTQEDPTHINIYTDGSKSELGVGAGIAIKKARNSCTKWTPVILTSKREAFAILKALEQV